MAGLGEAQAFGGRLLVMGRVLLLVVLPELVLQRLLCVCVFVCLCVCVFVCLCLLQVSGWVM